MNRACKTFWKEWCLWNGGYGIILLWQSSSCCCRINQLVKYVTSLPSKFDIKLNGFCCYHKKEFDRLKQMQTKDMLKHYGMQIMVDNN
jgi:hypothetical protein